jgi:hypothetical protein
MIACASDSNCAAAFITATLNNHRLTCGFEDARGVAILLTTGAVDPSSHIDAFALTCQYIIVGLEP